MIDREKGLNQKANQKKEEKKRSSETEDHEKQRLATLKRLTMESDEERKARLNKMVATKQLGSTLETEKKEGLDWFWI